MQEVALRIFLIQKMFTIQGCLLKGIHQFSTIFAPTPIHLDAYSFSQPAKLAPQTYGLNTIPIEMMKIGDV